MCFFGADVFNPHEDGFEAQEAAEGAAGRGWRHQIGRPQKIEKKASMLLAVAECLSYLFIITVYYYCYHETIKALNCYMGPLKIINL